MRVAPSLDSQQYTVEDLERLSAEGHHYELIRGDLRAMPPAGDEHGSLTYDLGVEVGVFLRGRSLGRGYAAETGFLVARHPDTVKAPDFAFIAQARLAPRTGRGYVPIVPDLVLETRSPNDTGRAVSDKVAEWLEAGVRIVWELDPSRRILTVHRPDQAPRALGTQDILEGEDVLPGFSLPLRQLFQNLTENE